MPLNDSFTKALLHMNGADASTTFTDESGKTWTANGNAQIDIAQFKFGVASGLFDGTGDYISTPDHDDWQLDGGSNANEWTIDFWIRFNGDPGTGTVGFVQHYAADNAHWVISLENNNLRFRVDSSGTIVDIQNAWNPATATWYHVAVVKQGATGYKMFIDGTQIGTTQTDTSTIPNFAGTLWIGQYTDGGTVYLNGWIDEVRISKGVARWTANFTPPASEYSSDSNTKLLLHFDATPLPLP